MKKLLDNTAKLKIGVLLFFVALFLAEPYVVRIMLDVNFEFFWIPIVILLWFISLTCTRKTLPLPFIVCCLIQVLVWMLFYVIHKDGSYLTRIVFIIASYIFISSLDRIVGLKEIIRLNNGWMALQSCFGAIAFVLLFIGIIHPLAEYTLVDGRPFYFFGITCSNAVYGNIMRPAGFFDEPGALACWGIYALVFNKLFVDNKRVEYVLIVTLLFTLSLAYYVQLLLYLLLFYSNKLKTALPIALLLGAFIMYVSSDTSSELYDLTLGRISIFADDGLETTSRAAMTEVSKAYFKQSPWIGIGAQASEDIGVYASDNPYETLGKDGIVGTLALYLPLLYVLIQRRDRFVFASIIVLAAGYMQRPFHLNLMHYFMMYSFCILVLSMEQLTLTKSIIQNDKS